MRKPRKSTDSKKGKSLPKGRQSITDSPGFVASLYELKPFRWPGEAEKPKPAESPASLAKRIRWIADAIEKDRFPGCSEVWAARMGVELLEWLASRSGAGSTHAQIAISDMSNCAVGWYLYGLSERQEHLLELAKRCADIPGRISLNPEVSNYWQGFLSDIKQGSKSGVPMERDEGKKRSARDVMRGNHDLVARLYQYFQNYRKSPDRKLFEVPVDHPDIPPIGREILQLPDLESDKEAWRQWQRVGWKFIKELTGDNPATHPAFNRPPLAEMNRLAGDKSTISKDLGVAWEKLGRGLGSIESA